MKSISKKMPASMRNKQRKPKPDEALIEQLGISLLMLAAGLAGIGDLLLKKPERKKIKRSWRARRVTKRGGFR